MHPHCQAKIDARDQALQAYLRACLLRDYAMNRMQATAGTSAGDWWIVKFEELSLDADRLEPKMKAAQQEMEKCLSKWGGSAPDPSPEPPPRDDDEFDQCMKHAPGFVGDWL